MTLLKSVASFAEKAARMADGTPLYPDPLRDITDQIGIRVITYVQSDVDAVADLLADQVVEIISGASGDAPLATLLRQLKVLAARTDASSLDEWVAHELAEYPDSATVPSYRGAFPLIPLRTSSVHLGARSRTFSFTRRHSRMTLRAGTLFNLWLTQPGGGAPAPRRKR